MAIALRTAICLLSIVIALAAAFFHIFGIYLLKKVNMQRGSKQSFLIHLNVLEICLSVSQSVIVALSIFISEESGTTFKVYDVFLVIHTSGFVIICSLFIILLTFDRFLEVWLNIKYEVYITSAITKTLVFGSYFVGFVTLMVVLLLKFTTNIDPMIIFHSFVFRILMSFIVVHYVVTYVYIFYKLRNHRKVAPCESRTKTERTKAIQAKKNKQLRMTMFAPFWIILTFFIFVFIPEIILKILFYVYKFNKFTSPIYPLTFILFSFGSITDVCIYTYMLHPVRRKFIAMVRRRKRRTQRIQSTAVSTTEQF